MTTPQDVWHRVHSRCGSRARNARGRQSLIAKDRAFLYPWLLSETWIPTSIVGALEGPLRSHYRYLLLLLQRAIQKWGFRLEKDKQHRGEAKIMSFLKPDETINSHSLLSKNDPPEPCMDRKEGKMTQYTEKCFSGMAIVSSHMAKAVRNNRFCDLDGTLESP
ncbi:hypothetical protein CEXT_729051 [Caerostris extrusa]|uniref:Uncharacterized protein n=1 Tax=Caerostris extrusa TaxID=172846 RepID=A0AAV4PKR2_CAEEX|nr:hypothetical protein CEXT_729051 [Caerostris extrusa]